MKVPIIGTSSTKFGELWDKGFRDLIRESGRKALENAKIKASDIDAVYVSNAFSQKTCSQALLSPVLYEELGISNSVCINGADCSGAIAINEAAKSIVSGENKIVMALGFEKISDFKPKNVLALTADTLSEQESKSGATIFSQFALITQKYLHDFKLKPEDYYFLLSESHKNAIANENAQYRFELSEEKIKSSPIASEPLRMFECASYCDGAAAVIMCNEDVSKKLDNAKGFFLSGSVKADTLNLAKRESIIEMKSTINASIDSFKMSGLQPSQIGAMEIYDLVPIAEVIAVEDIGFAKKGYGIEFVKKNIKRINLSGGLKACGHAPGATGIRQAISLIHVLRKNKIDYGLTQTLAGTGALSAVNIFSSK